MVRRTVNTVARVCAFVLGVAGVLLLMELSSSPASAQTSSSKPIRIIIPFGPAGSADVIARVLQQPLGQALKQNIIIENRPGAGSNLGTAAVAHAEPDGATLLITTSAFVANPALYKNLPYDPVKDFAPIADLAVAPNIIAALPNSELKTLRDVIARAKADPQKLNYASPGNGTTPQLTMELFKLRAGNQPHQHRLWGRRTSNTSAAERNGRSAQCLIAERAGAGAGRHHEGTRHDEPRALAGASRHIDLR